MSDMSQRSPNLPQSSISTEFKDQSFSSSAGTESAAGLTPPAFNRHQAGGVAISQEEQEEILIDSDHRVSDSSSSSNNNNNNNSAVPQLTVTGQKDEGPNNPTVLQPPAPHIVNNSITSNNNNNHQYNNSSSSGGGGSNHHHYKDPLDATTTSSSGNFLNSTMIFSDTTSVRSAGGYSIFSYGAGKDDQEEMIDYYVRLVRFYKKYNPDKLDRIDEFLLAYKGEEEQLFANLKTKYGPEPPTPSDEEYAREAANFGRTLYKVPVGQRVLTPKAVTAVDGNTEFMTPYWPGTHAVSDRDLMQLLLSAGAGNLEDFGKAGEETGEEGGATRNGEDPSSGGGGGGSSFDHKHLAKCFLGVLDDHPGQGLTSCWNGMTFITAKPLVTATGYLGHTWGWGSTSSSSTNAANGGSSSSGEQQQQSQQPTLQIKKLVYRGITFDRLVWHCTEECRKGGGKYSTDLDEELEGQPPAGQEHERWRLTMYQVHPNNSSTNTGGLSEEEYETLKSLVLYRTIWDPVITPAVVPGVGPATAGSPTGAAMQSRALRSGRSDTVFSSSSPVARDSTSASPPPADEKKGGFFEKFLRKKKDSSSATQSPEPAVQPVQPVKGMSAENILRTTSGLSHHSYSPSSSSNDSNRSESPLPLPEEATTTQQQVEIPPTGRPTTDKSSKDGNQSTKEEKQKKKDSDYQQPVPVNAVDIFVSHMQSMEARIMTRLDTFEGRLSTLEKDVSVLKISSGKK